MPTLPLKKADEEKPEGNWQVVGKGGKKVQTAASLSLLGPRFDNAERAHNL